MNTLNFVIANASGNIYWKDKKGYYLGCNFEFASSVGLNVPEDIIGKSDRQLFLKTLGEEDVCKIEQVDQQVIHQHQMIVTEEIGINQEGKKIYYLTKKIPLKNEHNQVIGVMGTSIDITEQKLAEEREKAAILKAIDEAKAKAEAEEHLRHAVMVLTGSIAHDLRSPLMVIRSCATLLSRHMPDLMDIYNKSMMTESLENNKIIPKKMRDYLPQISDDIKKTVGEMNDFIDITLKTLSQVVQNNFTKDDLMTCSMWHCIHNTLFRYPFIQEQRGLIQWDQKDFEFLGNELTMIRVFYNLLKNSLEQIEKNQSGRIMISTEITPQENRIRFRDTAGGAPPEIVQRLFEGYQTTKEKGTGVGLAFCKMALESFGAKITCESVYGEYIEFTLIFPGKLSC